MAFVMTRKTPHPGTADSDAPARPPEPDWVAAFFARANPDAEFDACSAMAQSAGQTLEMSLTLARSGRAIDLAGLDNWIGRLTAAALDLEPADGRRMQPTLSGLLRSLDALEREIGPSRASAPFPPPIGQILC